MRLHRVAFCSGLMIVALALASCGQSEVDKLKAEKEDLRSQVDQLNEKLDGVRSATSELREKVDTAKSTSTELGDEVSRFDEDNWRDVVGNVKGGAQQIDSDLSEVDDELSNVENATADD